MSCANITWQSLKMASQFLNSFSFEKKDENGNIKFFQVKDMKPSFAAITQTRLDLIKDMMKGKYDAKMEIKTFGARVAYYDDGLFSIFCTFLFPINVCDQKRVVH